jgi:hypothetical protein
MKNISEEVVKKIKEEKIEPKSKWSCNFYNGLWWAFFIVSILLGALFLAIIFFLISDIDWNIREHLGQSSFGFFFRVIPFIWIALSIAILLLAYLNLRNTRKGYKYSWLAVLLLMGVILLMSSVVLHALRVNKQANSFLKSNIPSYKRMVCDRENLWSQPERGLLAGTIMIFIQGDNKMKLVDFNNDVWEITFGENANIHRKVKLTERELIRLIGTGKDLVQKKFEAIEIMPWTGSRE